MSDKRNSRPRRQPEAGRNGAGQDRADRVPASNYNGDDRNRQAKLENFLGRGKSSAVTGRELAKRLGLSDPREVSRIVERERNSFIPICATCDPSNAGYYLPADIAELIEYNEVLKRRIKAIVRTQKAIETALARMCGQTTLGGWNNG